MLFVGMAMTHIVSNGQVVIGCTVFQVDIFVLNPYLSRAEVSLTMHGNQ